MEIAKRISKIEASKTLQIKEKALELKAKGFDVVDVTAGEPDFNTPEMACQAGIHAINDGFTKYTANTGIPELRQKIAEKLQKDNQLTYTPNQIVVSSGAKQSILNALFAIVSSGQEVVIADPYWVSYPEQVKIADGIPKIINTSSNHYKMNTKMLENAITKNTVAVILNSPSNPTGVVYTPEELEDLAVVLQKHDVWIISDEIYEKIIYDGLEHKSIATYANLYEKTILINGFSKAYSMTGWRIGYAAAPINVVKAMSKIQSHYTSNASSISQKAALGALNSPENEIIEMRKIFEERRDFIKSQLDSRSYMSYILPQGAFYFFINISASFGSNINGNAINNSVDFSSYLTENHYVVTVPGIAFGADEFIRLSFAASMEQLKTAMSRLLGAMDQIVENKKS